MAHFMWTVQLNIPSNQETIHMKDHALFVIFENVAQFEIVVCCKL